MIKFAILPSKNWDGFESYNPDLENKLNITLSDSEEDYIIYYWKLFENRESKHKQYIDKYNSLLEIEEDIYGNCWKSREYTNIQKSFKKIYESLDKEKFLEKINNMINEYGYLIPSYCAFIKLDSPILDIYQYVHDYLNDNNN